MTRNPSRPTAGQRGPTRCGNTWPLIVIRTPEMQTLPLGLARFLSVMEDTTGALFAFVVMVLVPGLTIFLMAQKEFIRGLTSGATKG